VLVTALQGGSQLGGDAVKPPPTFERRLSRSVGVIVALTLVASIVLLLKARSVKSKLPQHPPATADSVRR
jgi:hypothetical protein